MDAIPEEDRGKIHNGVIKNLGIYWDLNSDEIFISGNEWEAQVATFQEGND